MAGNLDHLYDHRRWRRVRRLQLLAEPLCRFCAQQGRTTPATICDHVTPHHGDVNKFWLGPFQSLCKPCHDSLKQQQERTGFTRGCDETGMPLDPGYPVYARARD